MTLTKLIYFLKTSDDTVFQDSTLVVLLPTWKL